MSSQSRESFRIWPLALAMTGMLAVCLLVLAVHWGVITNDTLADYMPLQANHSAERAGESPAQISSATLETRELSPHELADQLFGADATLPPPSLSELATPAKRVDFEPLAANELPLIAPHQMKGAEETATSSVTSEPADEASEETPPHLELFDWQQAVLSPPPTLSTIWSKPHLLLSRLEQLPLRAEVVAWRSDVQLAIGELLSASSLRSTTATAAIDRLEMLFQETPALAAMLPPTMLRYRMHATADTLRRNTNIWRATQHAAIVSREEGSHEPNMQVMLQKLDAIEAELDREANAPSWRQFLELSRLWQIARAGNTSDPRARLNVALRLLHRIDETQLAENQQAVLAREPFEALYRELQVWAYQPTYYEGLLFELQRYEAVGREQEAERIMATTRHLARSPYQADRDLAKTIQTEYRGAGLRIAVTETLLNRFLPPPTSMQEPVKENIRGADVRGESNIQTGLHIRLLPDANRIRLGLEARGEVTSNTTARKGPATFYSTGRSRFLASKLLLHDGRKLFVWRSDVATDVNNRLAQFETDYDDVPLINMFARSMALQQHDEEAPLAKQEVEAKLRAQLQQRFDEEIHGHLLKTEKQLKEKVLVPLTDLQLDPSITGVRTTETRLIGHYRLAGDSQLTAAQTRVWAPSASLISMQLHQSTVNNILNQLELAGRKLELRELYEELAATFNLDSSVIPDDLPEDVIVHFAAREPVRVDFHENTVSLTMHIRELIGGNRRFRNFTVRAHYEPETTNLSARLFRRSYVELIGERLSFGDQIALRGVFSKAFSKQRPIALLDKRLTEHDAFKSLALIQFQVEYGWIALAVGREGDAVVGQTISEVAEKPGEQLR